MAIRSRFLQNPSRSVVLVLVAAKGRWLCRRVLHTLGVHPLLVDSALSAMRSPHGGFGWGVLVKVDDRPVFARCFPRSRNGVVRFCESPAADLLQGEVSWVRANNGCGWCCPQGGLRPQMMRPGRIIRVSAVHESTGVPHCQTGCEQRTVGGFVHDFARCSSVDPGAGCAV